MTRVHFWRAVPIGVAASLIAALPAHAQSAAAAPVSVTAPATQAQTDDQVRAVRDELERLKKEFEALRQNYDQRLSALEQRLGSLVGPSVAEPAGSPASAPPPASAPAPAPASPPQAPIVQQNMAGASKAFNPDSSVIANFIGASGKNPVSGQPALQLTEAEAAFQAIVDPYARADFFLSAGPEGLSVEEGFVTFNTLPGNFLLKVGKMRASFGKVNTLHTHAMPTADRPLVTANLVGGEDGISDSGLSLSRLIPNSFLFLEATGEVFQGDSAVFHSTSRSKLNYVGRLRAYRDLTEGTNLDIGTSVAFGPGNLGDAPNTFLPPVPTSLDRRLIGLDATFRYRPLRRAIYKRFQARTEMVWSQQDTFAGSKEHAFGFYALGEYQFARRWYFGGRLDQSERAFDHTMKDSGGSLFLTYWPSEFSQIRGQLRRTKYAEGVTANEFLFQFNFAIGAHGAHVF